MIKDNKPAILITGASRRIGRAMALRLAKEGYNIALHYHTSVQDALRVKQEIEQLGQRCELLVGNLAEHATCVALIEEAKGYFPALMGLINNASIFTESPFLETDKEMLNDYLDIHLKGPFWLTQAFARKVKSGVVVNMLDTDIINNSERFFTYLLTKKLLAEFTLMSARVLAPSIRVNAIAPGKVLPSDVEDGEAYLLKKQAQIPMKVLPTLDQVTDALIMILQNTYLTGQIIFVDGAEHLL